MRGLTKREQRLRDAITQVYAFIGYEAFVPHRKAELEASFREVYGCEVWDRLGDLNEVAAEKASL